jgi:uncharacterized protein YukE
MTRVTPGAAPADLVPGDPHEVELVALRLTRVAASARDAADKLDTIEGDAWTGAAAELYRGAIGDVPTRLSRAAEAFASAAQALRDYARVLREAQASATQAVRMVERSTPETAAADQQSADSLLARATEEVDTASRLAAERLGRAQADAPTLPPPGTGGELALQVGTERRLEDPDGYVSPPGDWGGSVADMRYTSPHDVAFAGVGGESGGGTGDAGWQAWAASGSGREVGVVQAGTVAAAGAAAAGVTFIGRRRDRTALGLVGLDEAELRRRRDEFGGARHRGDALGSTAPAARLGGPDIWRTRLAPITRPAGTVQHWTGSGAGRLPRASVLAEGSGAIDRDVRGAILRIGRPATEAS